MPRSTLGTSTGVWNNFQLFNFWPPTGPVHTVHAGGKAVGERQERLNDQSYGHILPQHLKGDTFWALLQLWPLAIGGIYM